MTPEQTLDKYRTSIVAVNSDLLAQQLAMELAIELKARPGGQPNKEVAMKDPQAGTVFLYRNAKHPGKCLEMVVTVEGGHRVDSISTVMLDCSHNGSLAALRAARIELISAVAKTVGLPPESVGIEDHGRGRTIALHECSTCQLVDMIAQKTGTMTLVGTNETQNAVISAAV